MLSGCLLTACAGVGDTSGSPSPSPAPSISELTVDTSAPRPPSAGSTSPQLRIVLTNDDGVKAAGIDAIARSLSSLPDVDVTIVAPVTNRSGTGWATTNGGADFSSSRTSSGLRATAVDGYPADSVAIALEDLDVQPHLVVSGVNRGVNAGSATPISGTVGAARAAISSGVPAIAASAAVPPGGGSPNYAPAVRSVTRWVTAHRAELVAGTATTKTLVNVNTPYCANGLVRGEREVAVAERDVRPARVSDCRSSLRSPDTDVEALNNGYIAISRVRADLATPDAR